jgi:hypothetical protein
MMIALAMSLLLPRGFERVLPPTCVSSAAGRRAFIPIALAMCFAAIMV